MKDRKSFFIYLYPALFCAFFLFGPRANASVEDQPLTLQDCYKLALKQSELIAINGEKIKEAEAHFLQALGTIMPQVSFSRVDTRNDSASSSSFNRSYEQKFVFKQALFSGFKEFAGMAGSHYEKSQRENEKTRAEQLLFVDVSDAFYFLIEIREDLKTLEAIKQAFADRVGELKTREAIGKSRTSEVVSTETQLYSIQDQIELSRNQELVARELLSFLTGRPIDKLFDADIDATLKPESAYLAKSSSRTDVVASRYAWQVDQKQVAIAKSGFFPTLNLEADSFTHRSSVPKDSNWVALLTLEVPIFEGTTTFGQVKEARAIARESELTFKRTERLAAQDIHDTYVNMQADIVRKAVLAKALKSAELNYHLQTEDYKLNVVNNLDVLTAIQSLEDVRRNYIHISYETKRFYWQLLVATGDIAENII